MTTILPRPKPSYKLLLSFSSMRVNAKNNPIFPLRPKNKVQIKCSVQRKTNLKKKSHTTNNDTQECEYNTLDLSNHI